MKLIGKKIKMTQLWKEDKMIGVTVVKIEESSDISGLKSGDLVKVSGTSKGRGFQGVVKRHGFHGGPKTHGQKNRLRAPGSIGNTTPQRVLPGRKMAGHMGNVRVSVKNLKVIEINPETRELLIRGAVPGNRGSRVEVSSIINI